MENIDRIKEKLKKLKALAEKGIGGEKESAQVLYEKLLAKYELDEELLTEEKVETQWLRYDDDMDKQLLTQIFYKVTGSTKYWEKRDKRRKLVGVECTEFELSEIIFYYQFYRDYLTEQLNLFFHAFVSANDLFPDVTARCYDENEGDERELSMERLMELEKIWALARNIDKKTPAKQIEQKY